MTRGRAFWVAALLAAGVGWIAKTEYDRVALAYAASDLQHLEDDLGFKPGTQYCFAPDADKNSNGLWPTSYMVFEELLESLRAHDPVAPKDLMANSIHIYEGYQIWILETDWQLGYTKGRISRVPQNGSYNFRSEALGSVVYTLPLSKFWIPCK
jgi:hypothetical protein